MEIDYAVKFKRMYVDQRAALAGLAARMPVSGAEVIITACTDTPIAISEKRVPSTHRFYLPAGYRVAQEAVARSAR